MRGLPTTASVTSGTSLGDGGQGLDQHVEALVGTDQAEEEDAGSGRLGSGADGAAGMEQRVRDDRDALGRDTADLDQQSVAAGRSVHDHAIAARVELGPQLARSRASGAAARRAP